MKNSPKLSTVDWYAYAQKYDMLLTYNPYYQEVRQFILELIEKWSIKPGDQIADLGAGTGNYSIEVARLLPQAYVLHVENNPGMNALTKKKAKGLNQFEILNKNTAILDFEVDQLEAILCINALYTFPDPRQRLKDMYEWLKPGGTIILVDPGRIMNVNAWKMAISWHLIKNYGLRRTLNIFKEAKTISDQNAYIREMQVNGTYWTHSHKEFCATVEDAGFTIQLNRTCFRGDCDLVVAKK